MSYTNKQCKKIIKMNVNHVSRWNMKNLNATLISSISPFSDNKSSTIAASKAHIICNLWLPLIWSNCCQYNECPLWLIHLEQEGQQLMSRHLPLNLKSKSTELSVSHMASAFSMKEKLVKLACSLSSSHSTIKSPLSFLYLDPFSLIKDSKIFFSRAEISISNGKAVYKGEEKLVHKRIENGQLQHVIIQPFTNTSATLPSTWSIFIPFYH